MPIIEPPKFTEGHLNLAGAVSQSAGAFGPRGGAPSLSKRTVSRLKDLENHHTQNSMKLMSHAYDLQSQESAVAHTRDMEKLSVSHEQAKDLASHTAGIAATQTAQEHANAIAAATHGAKLENKLASATHRRSLELHNAINSSAQGNTELSIKFPAGGEVSYTKSASAPAATEKVESSEPSSPRGLGWNVKPAGATSLPLAGKPAAPTAEGPKPLVKKGPGGRFQSLKSTEQRVAKPKKSSTPKVTGPTVKKGPGGRFQSLKD
jgi:hypothetical protein